MKKNCPQCNKEFSKPINESKKAWQFRHKFCPNCHSKTNHDREKWSEYFINLQQSTVA